MQRWSRADPKQDSRIRGFVSNAANLDTWRGAVLRSAVADLVDLEAGAPDRVEGSFSQVSKVRTAIVSSSSEDSSILSIRGDRSSSSTSSVSSTGSSSSSHASRHRRSYPDWRDRCMRSMRRNRSSRYQRRDRSMRNKTISLVKVQWNRQGVEEASWEREENMRRDYPKLFDDEVY